MSLFQSKPLQTTPAGDDTDDRRQDAAATEERGSVEKETEAVPETTTEGQQALGQLGQALGLWWMVR